MNTGMEEITKKQKEFGEIPKAAQFWSIEEIKKMTEHLPSTSKKKKKGKK